MKSHAILICTLLCLSACQTSPSQPTPSGSNPETVPTNSSPVESSPESPSETKANPIQGDIPLSFDIAHPPELSLLTASGNRLSAKVEVQNEGSTEARWHFTFPALSSTETPTQLEVTYSNGHQYQYRLSAAQLDHPSGLQVSEAQGLGNAASAQLGGQIRSNLGWSLPDMTLTAHSLDPEHFYAATVQSEDCGHYQFQGLPPNTPIEIKADLPNFETVVQQVTSPSASEQGQEDLEAQKALSKLSLTPLHGQIEAAQPGSEIKVQSLNPAMPFSSSQSLNQGQFELNLPLGVELEISVQFDGSGFTAFPFNGHLERQYQVIWTQDPGIELHFNARNLSRTGDAVCQAETIEGSNLYGQILTQSGEAVSNAEVTLVQSGNPDVIYQGKVTTGSDGRYLFPGVPADLNYELKIQAQGITTQYQTGKIQSDKPNIPNLNRRDIVLDLS